jgi:predicted amidohydrolase YtcJ
MGGQELLGQAPADLVLLDGKIFTATDEITFVEAVAITDGIITAVGSSREIKQWIGDSTKTIELGGKLAVPGFIDAHCHLGSGGHSLTMLDLTTAFTPNYIQKRIAERIKELPPGALVVGYASYPNPGLFGELGWPSKEILDPVSRTNPVVLLRKGGHALWVNSFALDKSGISSDTQAPPGGEIVKDSLTGEPTGILKEAAGGLLTVWSKRDPQEDLERALRYAASVGVTSAQSGMSSEEYMILKQIESEEKLTLRISGWLSLSGVERYISNGMRQREGSVMLSHGALKGFIDGTLGVRTALLFEPFADDPQSSGLAQYEQEQFNALVETAQENNYQIAIHAIGDKGINWVLNAVQGAQKRHGVRDLRHRVEHATVMLAEDAKRFQNLGVVASMQPNITGDEAYFRLRLGEQRAKRVDVWRTLLDHGAVVAIGTDWPVSDLNPMFNLYRLVARPTDEKITMAEAIRCYTWGSAYASFDEDVKGTIEVGKLGDMVVLLNDLFVIHPREISKTRVLLTIVGGEVVYRSDH